MIDDTMTMSGSKLLARTIANYWAWRGCRVDVTVETQTVRPFEHRIYVVRSNMVNGFPPEASSGFAAEPSEPSHPAVPVGRFPHRVGQE